MGTRVDARTVDSADERVVRAIRAAQSVIDRINTGALSEEISAIGGLAIRAWIQTTTGAPADRSSPAVERIRTLARAADDTVDCLRIATQAGSEAIALGESAAQDAGLAERAVAAAQRAATLAGSVISAGKRVRADIPARSFKGPDQALANSVGRCIVSATRLQRRFDALAGSLASKYRVQAADSPAAVTAPALWLASGAVRALPVAHRARYREELAAELSDHAILPRRQQIIFALRLISQSWLLRRALSSRPARARSRSK